MSLYAMNESTERATLNFFLGTAQARARRAEACEEPVETWAEIMAAIPQHPAAMLGSAVDDAWLAALAAAPEPCPYCCAAAGEPCRFDCSSRFEGR